MVTVQIVGNRGKPYAKERSEGCSRSATVVADARIWKPVPRSMVCEETTR